MNDIEYLRKIYKTLSDEDKPQLTKVVENLKALQAENKHLSESVDKAPLPEAPTSATVKVINTKSQMEWWFTIRAHDPLVLLDRMAAIEKPLADRHYIALDAYIDQRRTERGETQPTAPRQPNGNGGNGKLTFQANTLVGSVNEGKVYWKVKGGQFTKFGVNIWPEVLEAAGFRDLDPLETYNLSTFTATYTKKEDGKIDKVVALVKQ